MQKQIIRGTPFSHVTYKSSFIDASKPLHIYIDGDGMPWRDRYHVADDPTPTQPLILKLLALDSEPALYLGRPCYHGFADEAPCRTDLWTYGRYGTEVTDSLVKALQQLSQQQAHSGLVLIGFSGGGTLAMLLAARSVETVAVVTVAGNLDTEAWTRYHQYTPLYNSLNPAREARLNPGIIQRHYVGLKDQRVPPFITYAYAEKDPSAKILEYPDMGHIDGWEQHWPAILAGLKAALSNPSRNHLP